MIGEVPTARRVPSALNVAIEKDLLMDDRIILS